MITRPLNLQSHLQPLPRRFNVVPLLDIILIALFFSLLGSKFVLAPGLTIELPRSSERTMAGLPTSAVLTVISDEMLFFQDRVLSVRTLGPELTRHVEQRGEIDLLIHFDREVSVQTLFSVAEIARGAGIGRVQLAFEPRNDEPVPSQMFR